jgi:hypothetical protein
LHRFGRDAFVASVRGHPPACLDFVGRDALDASTGEAQFGAAEEAVVAPIPDRPGAEPVLLPLDFGGARVAQRICGVVRRSCVLGFVEPCQREEDQPRC